jgi:methylenetetrahydrofolate reductase (NADPH)
MALMTLGPVPPGDTPRCPAIADEALFRAIVALARHASIEIHAQDADLLEAARPLLAPGTRLFVSHLPGQQWAASARACAIARRLGFQPVPHVPVRLLDSADALDRVLRQLSGQGGANEVMLVAGDYPRAAGPYADVVSALGTEMLPRLGFRRVAFAGHPEGHPKVPLAQIRAAELAKCRLAHAQGLEASLVTQFLFEAEPFLEWAVALRRASLPADLVCGLSGPATLGTLLKLAVRCGVGPSIRALGGQGAQWRNLLSVQGPEHLLSQLAAVTAAGGAPFSGVHLFGFGGFRRTVEWLAHIAGGRIRLTPQGGFEVHARQANAPDA